MRFFSNSCLSAAWSLTGAHVTTISALLAHSIGSSCAWMNCCAGAVNTLTRADKLPVKLTPENLSVFGYQLLICRLAVAFIHCDL